MGAAFLIAGDFGRHRTGMGFVLFSIVSLLWIAAGFIQSNMALAFQNGIMLAINLYGVWRYLISPKEKRVIDRMNEAAEEAESEVERELAEEKAGMSGR
ncbi:MAG: hypothetical protein KDE25_13325 [Novosphingobium sp.]|nr:hypothetical protein [Novosphingobium sp.]